MIKAYCPGCSFFVPEDNVGNIHDSRCRYDPFVPLNDVVARIRAYTFVVKTFILFPDRKQTRNFE